MNCLTGMRTAASSCSNSMTMIARLKRQAMRKQERRTSSTTPDR
jgi:hypothetical protein